MSAATGSAEGSQPIFYYDLASPACYLVAESIMSALPTVPEWEPVHAWSLGASEPAPDRAALEQLADTRGLQPLRWPPTWPPDTREAMLAATYAKHIGRAVAFSLACFRQAFAGGRDLGERDTVLIAGAACELHPTALLKGISLRSTAEALELAGARARRAGVRSLPTIEAAGQTFAGLDGVAAAARALKDSG